MSYQVQCFYSYDELPPRYTDLLETACSKGFFYRREWLEFLMRDNYPDHQQLRLYAVEDSSSGRPLMLVPLRFTRSDAAVAGAHTLASIGHMENYAPAYFVIAESAEQNRQALLTELFRWLRDPDASLDKIEVIRLWPFADHSALGNDVLGAVEKAGFAVQTYSNAYNQHQDCKGISYDQYFKSRSSNQRYNSRRRLRNLQKEGVLEFEIHTRNSDLKAYQTAVDDYILVSVHSWKPLDSTVSASILEIMDMAAAQGSLRLGILKLDGRAIAAQFWIYSGGIASMMRPNFHERYKKLAPGVVLTNFIIEYLLDNDQADALDLGYGNDEYKGKWVDSSRAYSGLMAFNPGTLRGVYFGIKHIFGRRAKHLLKRRQITLATRESK